MAHVQRHLIARRAGSGEQPSGAVLGGEPWKKQYLFKMIDIINGQAHQQ